MDILETIEELTRGKTRVSSNEIIFHLRFIRGLVVNEYNVRRLLPKIVKAKGNNIEREESITNTGKRYLYFKV